MNQANKINGASRPNWLERLKNEPMAYAAIGTIVGSVALGLPAAELGKHYPVRTHQEVASDRAQLNELSAECRTGLQEGIHARGELHDMDLIYKSCGELAADAIDSNIEAAARLHNDSYDERIPSTMRVHPSEDAGRQENQEFFGAMGAIVGMSVLGWLGVGYGDNRARGRI